MHRALSSRWLKTALNIAENPRSVELPLFLYPSINCTLPRQRPGAVASSRTRPSQWKEQHRCLHVQTDIPKEDIPQDKPLPTKSAIKSLPVQKLPKQCRGCGALSQTTFPDLAGYFDLSRKAVINYMLPHDADLSRSEDAIYEDALKHFDHEELKKQGVDVEALAMSVVPSETNQRPPPKVPLCERCHNLLHHHTGESIYHPSIESIRDTILESPYKQNHVYHLIDAADFPMSILPRLSSILDTVPLRTKNRRSKPEIWYRDRKTTVTFVITRCDLLAPTEAQVEKLFPYLREVLREALGRAGRNVRLGNVLAVSSRRSWRTKELKGDIWKRGGAGWMVGKVNVGKSQLFEAVFPKGRMGLGPKPSKHQITIDMRAKESNEEEASVEKVEAQPELTQGDVETQVIEEMEDEEGDDYTLLPPAPEETDYPEMPLVSDLPGTTASPIRILFGNGRGELIDLPGLERTGLEKHVKAEHRLSLVMRHRIVPEQMTLKPGQSLLLGGFIRITPREPAPVMLTYAFTPLHPHVTRTSKAELIQNQDDEVDMTKFDFENIAVPGTGEKTKLAGSFQLKWDVTRQRTGPLMRKDVVGLKIDLLPYRVLSTDLLIEGVGWVEITTQVRTKDLFERRPTSEAPPVQEPREQGMLSALERLEAVGEDPKEKMKSSAPWSHPTSEEREGDEPNWPIVDVYSPEGKFISCRQPMNGWLMNKPKQSKASKRSRPRRSMSGMKKLAKKNKREGMAAASPASSTF
ncbi:hypothetical protein F4804DRAFT_314597 [Jackrogersella minutella]|nr:hypothetical protein F4804DRAFT_314597 [Jackrogersella minutella]